MVFQRLFSFRKIYKKSKCLFDAGDNFFFGQGFYNILKKGTNLKRAFFLANVPNPEKYAVLEKKIIKF